MSCKLRSYKIPVIIHEIREKGWEHKVSHTFTLSACTKRAARARARSLADNRWGTKWSRITVK